MTLPPGFEYKSKAKKVCKQKKSLHGLKQSPRAWFDKFSKVLKKEHYLQGQSDCTLFVKHHEGKRAILIVYVDDMVLTGEDIEEIERLNKILSSEFKVRDLGHMCYFLGMEVARSRKGIHISQRKYILDLLIETGMLGCKPIDTPITVQKKKKKKKGEESKDDTKEVEDEEEEEGILVDKERYQSLVGKLIYLSHTRPDIAFAVSFVSQHMHSPKEIYLRAVYKI